MKPVQRICFTLQVKPDSIDEYRRLHASVWPEMRQALRDSGWMNYAMFLRDDGLVVGHLETKNFARSVELMQQREVNRLWQAEMASLVDAQGFAPDTVLKLLEPIFLLN